MPRAASLLLVVLSVALWAAPGWAFAPDPESVYSTPKTTIRATSTNPNWNPAAYGNDYRIQRNFEMAAPAGKKVPVKAYITVPKAGASGARRFMAKALKGVPLVGTGIVLWELWQDYGIRPKGDGEGLEKNPGEAPQTTQVPCWRETNQANTFCASTAAEAAVVYGRIHQGVQNIDVQEQSCASSPYQYCWYKFKRADQSTWIGPVMMRNYPTTGQTCRLGGQVRKDGLCDSDVWEPTTEEYAESRVQAYPPPSAEELAALEDALNWSPFPIPESKPYVTDVPNVGNTVTLTTPSGTTTTTETYSPNTSTAGEVDWTKTTTTTKPDGTTETETGEKPKALDPCGLPTTPPCAIDEKDTPKTDSLTNATKAVEDATKARQDGLTTVTSPTGKNTSWAWNLALPATCVPLNVDMRVGSIGRLVTINPCNWMSVIHDLVSMLWAGGTVFAVFGMVGRTLREA